MLLQLLFWIGESMSSLLCESAVHGTFFFFEEIGLVDYKVLAKISAFDFLDS
jgi:hypothetical protein